jgi:hypothetical protein
MNKYTQRANAFVDEYWNWLMFNHLIIY